MKLTSSSPGSSKFHQLMESDRFHCFLILFFGFLSVAGTIYWKSNVQSAFREDEADLAMQIIRVESFLETKSEQNNSLDWVFRKMYSDPDIYQDKPPLYYLLFASVLRFGFFDVDNLYKVNLIFLFLSVIAVFLIGKHLFNSRSGLFAATFWAFFPLNFDYARILEHESLLGYLSVILVYFILIVQKRSPVLSFLVSGLLIGVVMYIKQTFILYVLGVILFPILKSFFSDTSERITQSSFSGILSKPRVNFTIFFIILITLFCAFRSLQSSDPTAYIPAAINVIFTAFLIVLFLDFLHRIFKSGDTAVWGIVFFILLVLYNVYVLLPRPHLFGAILPGYTGLTKNLFADQNILFNLIALFYLWIFFSRENQTGFFRRLSTGLSLFFYRGFYRFGKTVRIPPFFQLALFFFVVSLVYLPFNHLYINKALLKWAIERQGAAWFGYGIFYPLIILLSLSLAQLVIFFLSIMKFRFEKNETLVFFWLAIPLFSFIFIFYNVETKYLFPAMPAFAILIGRIVDQAQSKFPKNRLIYTLFILSCLHLFLVYTFPKSFTSIPGRIFSLPSFHHHIRADITAFSQNNETVKFADNVVQCVADQKAGWLTEPVLIDDSVLKFSRLSTEHLNLRLMLTMKSDGDPHVFSTEIKPGKPPKHILVRNNSRLSCEFFTNLKSGQKIEPKCSFPIEVTRDYALMLSFAEGHWLRGKQFRNANYAIYELPE